MDGERMLHVIAYDVSDDGRRTRLASLLLDYGDRVQKSVFEAKLTREELKALLARAAKYLEEDDRLRVYRLCQGCARHVASLGRQPDPAAEGCIIV